MDFTIIDAGLPTILATGEIVPGDADRLRPILVEVSRDEFGFKRIALNSTGGSVEAALEVGRLIASFGAVTLVPPGADCASACAAILFTAGKYRKVLKGGGLGLHTCYNKISGKVNQDCNQRMSDFALEHGADYGAIMPFLQATRPSEMIWFSAEMADCYGLNRYPHDQEPPGYKNCVYQAIRDAVCKQSENCSR